MNIDVKILSGDRISLNIEIDDNSEQKNKEKILYKLNEINPIQYPLKRTILLKDDNDSQLYHAFIDTHLFISLTHISKLYSTKKSGFRIDEYICDNKNYYKDKDFIEGIDGEVFYEWGGLTALEVNFEMPNSTIYRVFVISTIYGQNWSDIIAIITYKYDTNSKEEYERIVELIKNKEIKLDEEKVKNVILKLSKNKSEHDINDIHDIHDINDINELYKKYKKYIYYRDDTIIVLDCNGKMVYTNHYNCYHYRQQPNWDY